MIFELCLITYSLDQTVCWRSQCLLTNVQSGDIGSYTLHVTVYTLHLLIYFFYVDSTSAKLWKQVSHIKQTVPATCKRKFSIRKADFQQQWSSYETTSCLQERSVTEPIGFYRAMHFSAYARSWDRMSSVRPSVSPSVTLVICDHVGWKSSKLIARTISPTPSLIVAKRRSTDSQGNMGKLGGD